MYDRILQVCTSLYTVLQGKCVSASPWKLQFAWAHTDPFTMGAWHGMAWHGIAWLAMGHKEKNACGKNRVTYVNIVTRKIQYVHYQNLIKAVTGESGNPGSHVQRARSTMLVLLRAAPAVRLGNTEAHASQLFSLSLSLSLSAVSVVMFNYHTISVSFLAGTSNEIGNVLRYFFFCPLPPNCVAIIFVCGKQNRQLRYESGYLP